uniref:Uncharacterized protein n=1 Tax=Arundo donax TaxID=35708 RepID=A0A0A8YK95_ARUDO
MNKLEGNMATNFIGNLSQHDGLVWGLMY